MAAPHVRRVRVGRRGVLGLALACLGSGGCALPVKPAAVAPADAEQSFSLAGRVAVRYGEESLSGKISWSHTGARDEIGLASPLGNQLALIVRSSEGVTLTDSNRNRHVAADAETLTERQLGWRLPLSGLTGWVRARPAAGAVVRRDALGRPVSLTESGWQIEFSYDGDSGLPRRLILIYTLAERALEIRLVIDEWT